MVIKKEDINKLIGNFGLIILGAVLEAEANDLFKYYNNYLILSGKNK